MIVSIMRKKVVTIGGGSGSFNLLKGLKKYAVRHDEDDSIDIKFIAASTDSGGSSGILRDEFGILPPGDMRQGLVALSDAPEVLKWLFGYRFKNERSALNGHNFGNLTMTALIQYTGGDEKKAWDEVHKILNVKGRVMPVTWEKTHIAAIYEDGTVLKKEHLIDCSKNKLLTRIKRLYSENKIKANPEALKAIVEADAIIIGPGDLYTSIICNFIVEGIAESIKNSYALKIYNCNIMTKPSETPNYSVADHLNDIEKYLGSNIIDVITYNTKFNFDMQLLEDYKKENKYPIRFVAEEFKGKDVKLIGRDLVSEQDIIRHDSDKIAKLMMDIIFQNG
jgi:uncharacterized cofD-like protein